MGTSHLHALGIWMCFSTVHAEMNLSMAAIQPSLAQNPVWWILIHFFIHFQIWSFTKSYSGSVTVQQEKQKLSEVFFSGLFGGGSLVCLNVGFGCEFIFGFAVLVSERSQAPSSADEEWEQSAGGVFPYRSPIPMEIQVGFDQRRETPTPRGWVLRTALFYSCWWCRGRCCFALEAQGSPKCGGQVHE